MKSRFLSFLPIAFIVFVPFFTILPLFHSGFFSVHDNTQVQRVFEMHKSLADGMLPVRWVDDLGYGYGYPLFNFYGPLAYYAGGIVAFFVDSLSATKVMIGIGMIGSGYTMYLFAKSFWGKAGGIVSSLLYLFAPYHAVDLYVRGDIGEIWAYAFLPLMFYGFYHLYREAAKEKQLGSVISNGIWIAVSAIGFAGIILSHNLSAFMVTPFLLVSLCVMFVLSAYKKSFVYSVILALLLSFGLSAFYWLPVFGEMKYTNVVSQIGGGANFQDHFVCLEQLWQSQWGFGGSTAGCVDGLSFMIGKIHILLSIVALFFLPFVWKRKAGMVAVIAGIIGLALSVFFMLPISKGMWESISQMAYIQYPWRYLLLASFFSSFLGGVVVSIGFQKQKLIGIGISLLIILAVLFLNLKYFQPQAYSEDTVHALTAPLVLRWQISRISDEYMPPSFEKPKDGEGMPNGLVVATKTLIPKKEIVTTNQKVIVLDLLKDQPVPIHLAYFPGWSAFDNNTPLAIHPTGKGMIVYLPSGLQRLTLRYTGTFIENLSNIISLTSFSILIIGIIWIISKQYEQKSV